MKKTLLCLTLALAMLLSLLAGCASSKPASEEPAPSEQPSAQASTTETPPPPSKEPSSEPAPEEVVELTPSDKLVPVELPLVDETADLSLWTTYPTFAANYVSDDMGQDFLVLKTLQERTNVHFTVTGANQITSTESFNLLIASGEYPDIIGSMDSYAQGYDAAIEEEVIIDLYDIAKEYAPNYWAYCTSTPRTMAELITDDGNMPTIATFYAETGSDNLGTLVRKDWLDKLDMEVPSTYDEMEAYLEVCVSDFGSSGMNLTYDGNDNFMAYGFDCGYGVYMVVDGQVTHSYLQEGYYDYLSKMADWYGRGLIYKDFYALDITQSDPKFASGELCASSGSCNTFTLLYNYVDEGTDFEVIGITPPKCNDGDEVHYSIYTDRTIKNLATWAVSTACTQPELVLIIVNYLFSKDGQLLFNYGVEGQTYTMDENGKPQWTEFMTKNPDMSFMITSMMYASNLTTVYAPNVLQISSGYYQFDDKYWGQSAWDTYYLFLTDDADGSYNYPDGAALTADEATEYAGIQTDIDTYAETMILGFITGETQLTPDSFREFTETIKSMNIARAIELKAAAYERYEEKLENLEY